MLNNQIDIKTSNKIVLTTLNARYIHSSFGLRYLHANLQELQDDCAIEEFTLESKIEDVVEQLLDHQPKIIGISVYIWNVIQCTQLVALLKAVDPDVTVVLGGPEVSYEQQGQQIVEQADYVITGWGDTSFRTLCRSLLNDEAVDEKIIKGEQAKLADIEMPYHLYSDDDIKNRILYVEASRGCPFKCEFCLSALDKTAWPFELEKFLAEMDILYQRGARHFKFVDRTFNLKVKNSLKILQFFLDRLDDELFLHFEVIPDHLPDDLKEMITKFPEGTLQFEIGIQTFNPAVQALISRKQDNDKAKANLQWIRQNSNAYIHADLIFGLPGESIESFAQSFNTLHALAPHEIQVGILKRLKGSPIIRHTDEHKQVFNPNPPFSIVSNTQVNYVQVQLINRFARYWDLIANNGRFKNTLPMLLADAPFDNFMQIVNGLYSRTAQTHKISLLRLFDLLFDITTQDMGFDKEIIVKALEQDFTRSGLKSWPKCLLKKGTTKQKNQAKIRANSRQSRHN